MKSGLSFILFVLLGGATAVLSASPLSPCDSGAFPNLVANCGFETGSFTDWTESGSFTFVFGAGANSGTYMVLMGTPTADGTLSQVVSTTPGRPYIFSFYFAADGDNSSDFSALWDGVPLVSLTDPNTLSGYEQLAYPVVGTGSDTIQFKFRDDAWYMSLDDVVVTPGPVPEPGTMEMLFAALGTLALIRRR